MSDDDWMNPQPITGWASRPKEKKWLIEREKRIQGPITQWMEWSDHDTEAERDAELAQLRSEHPTWHLRPSYRMPMIAIL